VETSEDYADGKCACGREPAPGFKTCCKSCPFLKSKLGIFGHDAVCDVRCNDGTARPWYWRLTEKEPHREDESQYVVDMGTKLMQATMPSVSVRRCIRNEDTALWDKYAARRARVRQKRVPPFAHVGGLPETLRLIDFSANTTLDRSVNEVWLFHGTSEEAALAIAKSDFRLPSGSGNFGKGLYFAEKAEKSDNYAKANSSGEKVMMLCRVILGNMYEMAGTDNKAENKVLGTDYDSLLGISPSWVKLPGAREFLVYETDLVYPEYIMFYK
jgi:hypothetical protein